MSLPKLCINRPVFTLVISCVLILFGIISFNKLIVRQYPDINNAVVSITTNYDGASPQLVEKEITTPLENSLSGIAGIKSMYSNSSLGRSRITLTFSLATNISETLSDIRDKITTYSAFLPQDSDKPVIVKNDSDARPTLIIGINDSRRNALEITDYIKRYIKPVIEEIDGVGEVFLYGERDYTIKIWLNPQNMAAKDITVTDIKQALQQQNVDIPSGQIKSNNRYFNVITHAKFDSVAQFKRLIIKESNGYIIRLDDVATVELTSQTDDNFFRINQKPAVGIAIIPQAAANPVEVSAHVLGVINKIAPSLPNSMKTQIVLDRAKFIKQSIQEVYKSLIEAILFVVIVVVLFLGNLRAALIPIVTVPICLVATFWPMKLLGFSINTITLLALVLAIGLVVDDAIVMLENIMRYRQQGLTRLNAAVKGSQEIVFAIIAMTLTLAAVYAPMGFIEGFTGKLFLQFGFTVSLAVIISGIVALTLSPMMCANLLNNTSNRYSLFINQCFDKLIKSYQASLRFCLNNKAIFLSLLFVFCYAGFQLYQQLPKEIAPKEDEGVLWGIVSSPTNASVDYTNFYAKKLESIYEKIKDKQTYLVSVRPTGMFSLLTLTDWDKRQLSAKKISQQLTKSMSNLIGVNAFAATPQPLGRRGGGKNSHSLNIVILSNGSYLALNDVLEVVVNKLKQNKQLTQVESELAFDSEQLNLDIKRDAVADLHVSMGQLAEVISTMLGGNKSIDFSYDGQNYPVIMQLARNERGDIAILDKLYIKNASDIAIPLSSLIKVSNRIGPDSLPHLNRLRSGYINAELAPGTSMGEAISSVSKVLSPLLPDAMQYQFQGSAKDYLESQGSTLTAFALALIFIYLVMSAQFESFIDPLIILFSVPLALIGAAFCLLISHGSLNIYTNIGMVTLIGLISKHGILITEFANQKIKQGVVKQQALIEAASLRLRPILMTTAAMILGALPLAFATGAGAEARSQLGLTIATGMAIGTFFSLYIVPIAFMIFNRKVNDEKVPTLSQS